MEPSFFADAMLGRLARWLRFLGYDVRYEPAVDDCELVERARSEGRVVLTRDHALVRERKPGSSFLVESDDPSEQLRQVARRFALAADPARPRRCTACNRRLDPIDSADAVRDVPPSVLRLHRTFHRCAGCGRTYWDGSHVARFREHIGRALAPR